MLHRKLQQSYSSWTVNIRKYILIDQIIQLSNRAQSDKIYSINRKVHDFLKQSDIEYFADKISKKYLQRNSKSKYLLCLADPYTAKTISSMISKHLSKNSSFVIECNPGLGLLTQELLNNGVSFIHLYEKCEIFYNENSPLSELLTKYNKKLSLTKMNFFDMWIHFLRDKHSDNNQSDILLPKFSKISWTKKPSFEIISTVTNRNFFTLLVLNFCEQTYVFDNRRPTFFIIVSTLIWMRLMITNKDKKKIRYYSHFNVILHLFFKFENLGEVSRTSFIPRSKQNVDKSNGSMIVIKLKQKQKLKSLLLKEDLKAFWFFLKHCMRSRKTRVIKELENIVPGCGLRLIKEDINICTTFKELTPKQLLKIFKNFRSWPEYDINLFFPHITSVEEEKKDEEKIIEMCVDELEKTNFQKLDNELMKEDSEK